MGRNPLQGWSYELAIRFEVAPAVVKRGFLVQYRCGNSHLIKRYKITKQYPEGEPVMAKKPKTVWVGSIPVTPISAGEHRRLEKRIKKKHEQLRRRYPEVHGKRVDWISHSYEEGFLFFNVRFTDGKNFSITCHPVIVTDIVDFSDMKAGDDVIIREYYQRRED
jgi:hypothetical protein